MEGGGEGMTARLCLVFKTETLVTQICTLISSNSTSQAQQKSSSEHQLHIQVP